MEPTQQAPTHLSKEIQEQCPQPLRLKDGQTLGFYWCFVLFNWVSLDSPCRLWPLFCMSNCHVEPAQFLNCTRQICQTCCTQLMPLFSLTTQTTLGKCFCHTTLSYDIKPWRSYKWNGDITSHSKPPYDGAYCSIRVYLNSQRWLPHLPSLFTDPKAIWKMLTRTCFHSPVSRADEGKEAMKLLVAS